MCSTKVKIPDSQRQGTQSFQLLKVITNPETVTVEPVTRMQAHADVYRAAPEHKLAYDGMLFDEPVSRRAKTIDVAALVSVDVVDVIVLSKLSEKPAKVGMRLSYTVGVMVEVSNSVKKL